MSFLLVSLPPVAGRRDKTWEVLQEKCSAGGAALSKNHKLDVPELRVGTLDTLLALSDDLAKVNNSMEAVCTKIRRTVADLAGPAALAHLKVDNLSPEDYLVRFKWDEPKFPTRRPLRETVDKITEIVGHLEDDLKARWRVSRLLLAAWIGCARANARAHAPRQTLRGDCRGAPKRAIY